ncbi:MAG TPA: aldo/keto reductase [Candidatus Limnocylindria bacterium]
MEGRRLGRSDVRVSAFGLGCWAIGGPTQYRGSHFGWGRIDEDEAIRAIHTALDAGITFFDTADVYGAGHSERILGKALAGRRSDVVIATKFGLTFDEYTGTMTGRDGSPEYVARACDASLRRLGTDHIDLYQFHIGDFDPAHAEPLCDALDRLVAAGKVRSYTWNSSPENARVFAEHAACTSIGTGMNMLTMFGPVSAVLSFCEERDLAAIVNGPLGKGLLTGKFNDDTRFPEDDLRHQRGWDLRQGPLAKQRMVVEELRDILTSDGRTLAQAALGALWARSDRIVPIPGFKNVAQVRENAGALRFGPLGTDQMRALEQAVRAAFTPEEMQIL